MERMLVTGAREFRERSILGLVIGQGTSHPYRQALVDAGYDCHSITSLWRPSGALMFRRLLLDHAVSVLHIHSEAAYLAAAIAAPRDVAVVRTVHSYFDPRFPRSLVKRAANHIADKRVNEIVVPTEEIARLERGRDRAVAVVSNWVDDQFFSLDFVTAESRLKNPTVLLVGNCSSIKRHSLALRAALDLEVPVVHLGDETHIDAEEEALLEELSTRGLLVFRGVGDPREWLCRSAIFCMPSAREGMGMSLAEALVAGCTALVSRSPGLEWAQHEPGVWTVPDTEWHDSLYAVMRSGDPGVPRALPQLRSAEGVSKYAAIYEQCLAQNQHAGGE